MTVHLGFLIRKTTDADDKEGIEKLKAAKTGGRATSKEREKEEIEEFRVILASRVGEVLRRCRHR